MADQPDSSANNPVENPSENRNESNENDLTRQVAARVWELWQQELRLERERRGGMRR